MKTNYFILILAAFISLQGCSRKEDNFAYWAKEVNVSITDNSLRAQITTTFKESCSYRIRYWENARGERCARTTSMQTGLKGENTCTLIFLYPETHYTFEIIVEDRAVSKRVEFLTGSLPPDVPSYSVDYSSTDDEPLTGYLLQWNANNPGYVTFCDYDGKVVWYQSFGEGIRTAHYNPHTGKLAVMAGFKYGVNDRNFQRLVSEVFVCDLYGHTFFRRKAAEGFLPHLHHEFKTTDDGKMLFVSNFIKAFDLRSRGASTESTDVWGDGFYLCSEDGKVEKSWDCFAELDPIATDYLDPVKTATDYIHANSVEIDSNGDYYMTFNRISELWKIDGNTGDVIYRLGVHGNVSLDGDFPSGGLHAAVALEPDLIMCYANGRDKGYSEGVVYQIDLVAKTATYRTRIVLPAEYSSKDRSNMQKIGDDLYFMNSTVCGKAIFVNGSGEIRRVISRSGISYRAYYFSM